MARIEWLEWKQRFSRFRIATKLNKEDWEVQVCSFIYAMGSKAEKIRSLEFEEEKLKKNSAVLKKIDEYFIPRQSLIHERVCFYQRSLSGEKAEASISVLYELAENCEVATQGMNTSMIDWSCVSETWSCLRNLSSLQN